MPSGLRVNPGVGAPEPPRPAADRHRRLERRTEDRSGVIEDRSREIERESRELEARVRPAGCRAHPLAGELPHRAAPRVDRPSGEVSPWELRRPRRLLPFIAIRPASAGAGRPRLKRPRSRRSLRKRFILRQPRFKSTWLSAAGVYNRAEEKEAALG